MKKLGVCAFTFFIFFWVWEIPREAPTPTSTDFLLFETRWGGSEPKKLGVCVFTFFIFFEFGKSPGRPRHPHLPIFFSLRQGGGIRWRLMVEAHGGGSGA